ncbi:MAG TPA: S9 family peptidase [Pyrinomonadaceae bacterium]|nr:S9 family peptidase [Pyrinomonadaceae bacterium]
MNRIRKALVSALLFSALSVPLSSSVQAQPRRPMAPADILRIANVGDAQISPNGDWIVYTVSSIEADQTVSTLWLVRAGERLSNVPPTSRQPEQRRNWDVPRIAGRPLLPPGWSGANPRWSPDGRSIAFLSTHEGQHGIWVSGIERRIPRLIAIVRDTNFFITYAGESFAWSPDSRIIAYVSASEEPDRDPPEGSSRNDDPRVIDRIQYKSRTSFSDRLRTHVWITDVDQPQPRQLTSGPSYDHALSFSSTGEEIAFISNHETDPDANNNSDIFAVSVQGQTRQITNTVGCEYEPAWSPDGKWIAYTATKREVTTIDSVAEDAHVWVVDATGGGRRELSSSLDRRARSPRWSSDSRNIFFLAGDRGQTLLYGVRAEGGSARPLFDRLVPESNQIVALSVPAYPFQIAGFTATPFAVTDLPGGRVSAITVAFTLSDENHPTELWIAHPGTSPGRAGSEITAIGQRLSAHNDSLTRSSALVEPQEITCKSFDGTEIQGWLMKPIGWREDRKYPLILSIHGGPHGMYGYAFNSTFQVYAARGYAVLYLNPRGSSGYGQKFSDGTINEWGGGDYRDLMAGVDEALRRYSWIDGNRMGVTGGSYGGFMTNWIITQTPRFKAAVSAASVSNLVSFYSTSLYQDLVHAEFGGFPWDNYDLLWQCSPLRYVRQAQTPTMFIHGEQDNDVHITQAEEMYMALRRRGVETVLVRYPREGHGLREPKHRIDSLERTLAWFDRFLK